MTTETFFSRSGSSPPIAGYFFFFFARRFASRAATAFFACADRSSGETPAHRSLPPTLPPWLPTLRKYWSISSVISNTGFLAFRTMPGAYQDPRASTKLQLIMTPSRSCLTSRPPS